MIFGILLVRIQETTEIGELAQYLVDEEFIVRLAAKSRLRVLMKEEKVDIEDPTYN